jgi:hypothetical protein
MISVNLLFIGAWFSFSLRQRLIIRSDLFWYFNWTFYKNNQDGPKVMVQIVYFLHKFNLVLYNVRNYSLLFN